MLIVVHPHIEGLFDLRHRAVDRHHQAIRGRVGHGETVGLGEIDHRLVILRRGAELPCELIHAEKMTVIGAGGVIKLAQQAGQSGLIAQRQHDGELHAAAWPEADPPAPPARWKPPGGRDGAIPGAIAAPDRGW